MPAAITKKLAQIQQTLSVPKNQYNSFGKYKYRSCEDILEGIKPCLKATDTALTVTDEIVEIGGRIYVMATAVLRDCEDGSEIKNTAYAREEESKKGMDASQVTGTASSYARKYALNGLFCIDDVRDADTMDNSADRKKGAADAAAKNEGPGSTDGLITKVMIQTLKKVAGEKGVTEKQICARYKVGTFASMRVSQFQSAMKDLEKTKPKPKQDLDLGL